MTVRITQSPLYTFLVYKSKNKLFSVQASAHGLDDLGDLGFDLHRRFERARIPRNASEHVHVVLLGDLDRMASCLADRYALAAPKMPGALVR